MCGSRPKPVQMPKPMAPPPVIQAPAAPTPAPVQQQPLQSKSDKPSLTIGGSRKKDSNRRRRGAGAVASAPAVNTGGASGGVNV